MGVDLALRACTIQVELVVYIIRVRGCATMHIVVVIDHIPHLLFLHRPHRPHPLPLRFPHEPNLSHQTHPNLILRLEFLQLFDSAIIPRHRSLRLEYTTTSSLNRGSAHGNPFIATPRNTGPSIPHPVSDLAVLYFFCDPQWGSHPPSLPAERNARYRDNKVQWVSEIINGIQYSRMRT